jgi:hypothetical protein
LRRRANQFHISGRPAPLQEGRFAIVTNVGCGLRWTLEARKTKCAEADGEVVWFRYLDADIKLATMLAHRVGDGGKKARSPGRARSSR